LDYDHYFYLRVSNILNKKAIEKSAKFAAKKMKKAVIMFDESKQRMYEYISRHIVEDGLIVEFGVAGGYSINSLAIRLPSRKIYGFDSFQGMTKDMSGWEVFKGDFSSNGIPPEVENNVEIIVGPFEETLEKWISENNNHFAFINIDCDLYESTSFILNNIEKNKIKSGTLILFDEFFGFNNWENHEFKAWKEFYKKNKIKFEYVAINHMQVLVKIL
jgi:predicted O-methyltransferase YrrM